VGGQTWEFQAGCFGLNVMPQIFMSVMKTLEKLWRKRGIQVFIYLDDILLVAPTQIILQNHLNTVVRDLIKSGFKINVKKSTLQPTQIVNHLGFQLNFQEGKLQVPPQKIKTVKKELGKMVKKDYMSKRQLAAILGQIRCNLMALPFLRAFTDSLTKFLVANSTAPWDSKHPISQEIKAQLREIKILLDTWGGRPFPQNATRELHSDSSTHAWGGLDIRTGKIVQEFWRENSILHINVKELSAAISTVKSLSKPGETVSLSVDNQVIYYYLTKRGSKKDPFNTMLRTFFKWCMEKNVNLQVSWVPSKDCLQTP
jgi:hypothetical protein